MNYFVSDFILTQLGEITKDLLHNHPPPPPPPPFPLKDIGKAYFTTVEDIIVEKWRRCCFHKGSSAAVLCVYTLQLNWFPAVCLYSVVHVYTV